MLNFSGPGEVIPSDIVFIVDSSGFQNNPSDADDWRFLQTFLRDLVARLGPTVRIGVVQYAASAQNTFTLNTNVNVIDRIGTIQLMNSNRRIVLSGIQLAANQQFTQASGDRPGIPNVAVVIMRGPQEQVIDS